MHHRRDAQPRAADRSTAPRCAGGSPPHPAWGFFVKLGLMALVNALGITIVISPLARAESWLILGVSVALIVIADWSTSPSARCP